MEKTVTVSQINAYIKSRMDCDEILSDIWISGEISNFKLHCSGHMYMSLKDSTGAIRAVMFRSANASLRFKPENGMSVLAHGRVSVYERDGQYQLYITEMRPDGTGDLYLAFEQLREKLKGEGLFDEKRKKSLPKYPSAIGVITSATGAAVRDIINVLSRRFPSDIRIYPVLVQGAGAAEQIADAVKYFNETKTADVLIVGRGGGSIEDLWAFNEEAVARAVSESEIPVISAVGHETDFTICDFAADLRAPTPSAAAELAVPDLKELLMSIGVAANHIKVVTDGKFRLCASRLDAAEKAVSAKTILHKTEVREQQLDMITSALMHITGTKLMSGESRLGEYGAKLDALSPLKILSRGYSAATGKNGGVIKSSAQCKKGDKINVRLFEGNLGCEVLEVE